jgi:hypothetical protein
VKFVHFECGGRKTESNGEEDRRNILRNGIQKSFYQIVVVSLSRLWISRLVIGGKEALRIAGNQAQIPLRDIKSTMHLQLHQGQHKREHAKNREGGALKVQQLAEHIWSESHSLQTISKV